MNTRRREIVHLCRWCKTALATVILAPLSVTASPHARTDKMTITDFRLAGADYAISGSKATIRGNRAIVTQMHATFYDDDNTITVETPHGTFDRNSHIGRSHAPVRIRGRNITIDGVGFDLDMRQHTVRVRDRVKVTVENPDPKLLGKD